ncbi:MAG: tetratricopeptide repeat protein [Anaerolineae bacterium]|nr:tetratricopeptide repeat protein [Anaerolineae bacterium]
MNQQPVMSHEAPIRGSQHLPIQPPEKLAGRESDLNSIHLALKAGTAVLLHGPAGIGKTALAASLAVGYAELPGGVVWLDVMRDSAQSLMTRIVRAYAADSLVGTSDRKHQASIVKALLQQNRPLIVLDGDIEADEIRAFVRECAPGIPLLFTHAHLIAGSWTPHAVEPLAPAAAEELLRHHARLGRDVESASLTGLLNILSGYPIAIEVAGIAARGTGVESFLAQLPKLPPGESNRVMGVLMAAYRILPKDLQGLLLVLGSAFTGGASVELLAAVGKAPTQVIESKFRQLAEHGFAYERLIHGQTYFFTHELVATFAQTFLRGKKQLAAMQERHLSSLATYIKSYMGEHPDRLAAEMRNVIAASIFAAQQHQSETAARMIQWLAPDSPDSFVNARGYQLEYAWLQRLSENPALADASILGEPEPEIIEELVDDNTLDEEEIASEEAVDMFASTEAIIEPPEPEALEPVVLPADEFPMAEEPPSARALPVFFTPKAAPESAAELEPEPDLATEAAFMLDVPLPQNAEELQRISMEIATSGETEGAIQQYAQAVDGFEADGNVEDELAAIEALAQLSLHSDQYDDVLKYVEKGTALAQEADNPQREGELLVVLGDMQLSLGRFDGAESAYKEAINAFRPTEAWLNIGLTLDKLAIVYDDQGRWQDAIDVWEQTLPIFARLGRTDLLRSVHGEIGDNQTDLMRWNQAKDSYLKALELAEDEDHHAGMYQEFSRLGWLMESSGNHEEAVPYYLQALHLALELDEQDELGETLLALARLWIDDTQKLNRVIQLLEKAQECLPGDTDVRRLLSRANTRKERLTQANVDLPPADGSLEEFASAAVNEV